MTLTNMVLFSNFLCILFLCVTITFLEVLDVCLGKAIDFPMSLYSPKRSILLEFLYMIKQHDQKQPGKERVYFTLQHVGLHSITEGSQGSNSRQEPGGRN